MKTDHFCLLGAGNLFNYSVEPLGPLVLALCCMYVCMYVSLSLSHANKQHFLYVASTTTPGLVGSRGRRVTCSTV